MAGVNCEFGVLLLPFATETEVANDISGLAVGLYEEVGVDFLVKI